MVTCRQGLSSQGEPPWDVHPLHATPRGPFFQLVGRRSRKAAKSSSASNRSRLRTKPTHATTDKHKFTQIEINSQSVFICVHLWFKLSFSKCRERLPRQGGPTEIRDYTPVTVRHPARLLDCVESSTIHLRLQICEACPVTYWWGLC